jgi:hypothetical protein
MDDRDEPEPIPPNVEYHIPVHVVGILEGAAHFRKVVPTSSFNDTCPRFKLIRSTGM